MKTMRLDRWWLSPFGTGAFLGGLTAYAIWAALQSVHFASGSYISPLYSPCIAAVCGSHANLVLIGTWWRWSPALLVVVFPIGVRATCYYYRKLYYRSFWLSPPACAVTEPHLSYAGESRFPLILQNVHRYFWIAGVLIAIMLSVDAADAFHQDGGVGIGVGTLLITLNAAAFWGYLLSCHVFRHLAGGGLRSFAGHAIRYRTWRLATTLNVRHGLFAWISLPMVMVTDGYVRFVSIGVFHDPRVMVVH